MQTRQFSPEAINSELDLVVDHKQSILDFSSLLVSKSQVLRFLFSKSQVLRFLKHSSLQKPGTKISQTL